MGVVFTHGLEIPETGGRPSKRGTKVAKVAGHLNVRMLTNGSVHVLRTEQVRVLEKCISGLKQKMLDNPSPTKPVSARRLPTATLLSPCVKRVYDSPSAVLESASTRKRVRSRTAHMGSPSTASVADGLTIRPGLTIFGRLTLGRKSWQRCVCVCVRARESVFSHHVPHFYLFLYTSHFVFTTHIYVLSLSPYLVCALYFSPSRAPRIFCV